MVTKLLIAAAIASSVLAAAVELTYPGAVTKAIPIGFHRGDR